MTDSGAVTENTRELGQKLKDTRQRRGLSQAKLAAILGVSPGALSRWESGTRSPKPTHLQRISCWLEQVDQD